MSIDCEKCEYLCYQPERQAFFAWVQGKPALFGVEERWPALGFLLWGPSTTTVTQYDSVRRYLVAPPRMARAETSG